MKENIDELMKELKPPPPQKKVFIILDRLEKFQTIGVLFMACLLVSLLRKVSF